jgi:hypothetical protein
VKKDCLVKRLWFILLVLVLAEYTQDGAGTYSPAGEMEPVALEAEKQGFGWAYWEFEPALGCIDTVERRRI